MANSKVMTYTQDGYNKLVEELEYLKGTRRNEVKEAIALARSFGDLSENAEYDEARNEQAKVEARIVELEALIENAEVVDEAHIDTSVVSVGSTVVVQNLATGKQTEYCIVGSNEVDPLKGKISDVCPIGLALSGKRSGDTVSVTTTRGVIELKIKSVARASV